MAKTESKTWLDHLYAPDAPELKAVREHRSRIQAEKDAVLSVGGMVENLEKVAATAWGAVCNHLSDENFQAWSDARAKSVTARESHSLLLQSSAHFSDALEGTGVGEKILPPALRVIRDRLAKMISALNDEHAEQLAKDGLEICESPAIEPLKKYLSEIAEALTEIPQWSKDNTQTAWRRFQHLIKR